MLTHIIASSVLHNAWQYLLHICRMAPTGASFCLVDLSRFLLRTTMELWIIVNECNYWTHLNCETTLCAAGMTAAVFFVFAVYFSSINHLRCYFWGFGSEADHVEWLQPKTSAFSSGWILLLKWILLYCYYLLQTGLFAGLHYVKADIWARVWCLEI